VGGECRKGGLLYSMRADNQLTPSPSLPPSPPSSKQDLEDSLNEIRILASFKHPRLIRWYETFVESDLQELCIVMELCPYGDLEQKIKRHQHRKQYIDERYACWFWCVSFPFLYAISTLSVSSIKKWC